MSQSSTRSRLRISLVRVLGLDRDEVTNANYNVGLQYLAAIARRAGADVIVYDPFDPLSPMPNLLLENTFDIVGFTLHHLNTADTLDLLKRLKARHPQTFIVLGGHHATATAEDLLQDIAEVDAVCCGEGEESFDRLVRAFMLDPIGARSSCAGVLRPTHFYDLDALPFPQIPESHCIGRISTSRGCPYDCSFCTTPGIRRIAGEPPFRSRSPASVVDELASMFDLGITRVRINDDIYIMRSKKSHDRAMAIGRLIRDRGLTIRYKAEYRVDAFIPPERAFLETLRDSGLREVFLGVESGSDSILAEYNKGLAYRESLEMVRLYDDVGIVVNAGNILASPDSTSKDVCDSINGFWQMGMAYLLFRRVSFRAHVFPGTVLEARLRDSGRLIGKTRYLPLTYTFRDPWLNDVCDWFEAMMPAFLRSGGIFFQARKDALEAVYEGRVGRAVVQRVLDRLNNLARNVLIKWFGQTSDMQMRQGDLRKDVRNLAREFENASIQLRSMYEQQQHEAACRL